MKQKNINECIVSRLELCFNVYKKINKKILYYILKNAILLYLYHLVFSLKK